MKCRVPYGVDVNDFFRMKLLESPTPAPQGTPVTENVPQTQSDQDVQDNSIEVD